MDRKQAGICPFPRADVLALVDGFVDQEMRAKGIPGLSLAITDRDRLLDGRQYGYADIAAEAPVTIDTLFEIGSIGKALTATCLLQLVEHGRIDLRSPVQRYLPWIRVNSTYSPITVHHLLTHTAGIVRNTLYAPDPRYEVWALRETETSCAPGEHFSYSNVGYDALGLLITEVLGKDYGDIVRERILHPLGMTAATSAIMHETRKRLAIGYVPFYDDRPWRPSHGLVPATWLETDAASGSIASNAADLAAFLRMLLNRGAGPRSSVLAKASFDTMMRPVSQPAIASGYGYGLRTTEVGGRTLIGHDGGMIGYTASMLGDLETGLGVVVLTNAPRSPQAIARFVLQVAIAASLNAQLPSLPPALPTTVENAADYAGTFHNGTDALIVRADGDQVALDHRSERVMLEPQVGDSFLADHPGFDLFPLQFGREEGGRVVEVSHGSAWYRSEHYAGPTTFDYPHEWGAYPGHYRSYNPWQSNIRILLRKGKLLLSYPWGGEDWLVPLGAGTFRVGAEEWSPERITFDTVVNDQALRARANGIADYYRFFTP